MQCGNCDYNCSGKCRKIDEAWSVKEISQTLDDRLWGKIWKNAQVSGYTVMLYSVWPWDSSDVVALKKGQWCKVSVSPRMFGCITRREHSKGGIINYDPSANRDKKTLNMCRVCDYASPLEAEESYRCRRWNGKSRGLPINWDLCLNMESQK